MLFTQKRFNKRIFSVVQRDGNYIFKLSQLPEEFREQLLNLFGNNKKSINKNNNTSNKKTNKNEKENNNADKKKASVKMRLKRK